MIVFYFKRNKKITNKFKNLIFDCIIIKKPIFLVKALLYEI